MAWLRFAGVQLVMLAATVLGWLLLIPFCLLQAWSTQHGGLKFVSIKNKRSIDRWIWQPLNYVYGNPEDGVSGQQAVIWKDDLPFPYMPLPDWLQRFQEIPTRRFLAWIYPAWRAYVWSGWRNSADNLKYVFSCESCPLKTGTFLGRPYKIGWQEENGYKVPVISWG
jgi:hypothetical protein